MTNFEYEKSDYFFFLSTVSSVAKTAPMVMIVGFHSNTIEFFVIMQWEAHNNIIAFSRCLFFMVTNKDDAIKHVNWSSEKDCSKM